MANPHRGDVGLDVAGKTYTLRFSTNALCELEDHLGEDIVAIGAKLNGGKVGVRLLRALVWGALRDTHPDVTIDQTGAVIDDAGGLAVVGAKIGDAFRLAFPAPEASDGAGPREGAQAGTGSRS